MPGRDDHRLVQGRADRPPRPLAHLPQVEAATAWWVGWFNNRRLYGPLGYIPSAEYERAWQEGRTPWAFPPRPFCAGPRHRQGQALRAACGRPWQRLRSGIW